MPDSTLLNLIDASTLTGAEVFYTVQDGEDKKVTLNEINGYNLSPSLFDELDLTRKQKTQVLRNLRGIQDKYTLPELDQASQDVQDYIFRNSITTWNDNGATNATVSDPETVRLIVNMLYTYVGKAAIEDIYFLSSTHNVITGSNVPAFLSASRNGTIMGNPTFSANGATFNGTNGDGIKLAAGLNLTDFTDIIVYKPNGITALQGLMGNYSQPTNGGYWIGARYDTVTINEFVGMAHGGVGGLNYTSNHGKPDKENRWQTVACRYKSGEQSLFLNGRYIKGAASTQAIYDNSQRIQIGAVGWSTTNTVTTSVFTGNIMCVIRLLGTQSKQTIARISMALRSLAQPSAGKVSFIGLGDSRTEGVEFSGGDFIPMHDPSDDQSVNWVNKLLTKSNWIDKACPYVCGLGGFSAHGIVYTSYLQRVIAPLLSSSQQIYMSIFVGINDFILGTGTNTAAYLYSRTQDIVNWAKARGIITLVIDQLASFDSTINTKVLQFNQMLVDNPLGDYQLAVYDSFPLARTDLYDGLHLTSDGNDLLADLVNEVFSPTELP